MPSERAVDQGPPPNAQARPGGRPQTPQWAKESEESSRDPTVGQPPPKEGPEGGPPKVGPGGPCPQGRPQAIDGGSAGRNASTHRSAEAKGTGLPERQERPVKGSKIQSLRGKPSEGQGATGYRPKRTAGARLRKNARRARVRRASPIVSTSPNGLEKSGDQRSDKNHERQGSRLKTGG